MDRSSNSKKDNFVSDQFCENFLNFRRFNKGGDFIREVSSSQTASSWWRIAEAVATMTLLWLFMRWFSSPFFFCFGMVKGLFGFKDWAGLCAMHYQPNIDLSCLGCRFRTLWWTRQTTFIIQPRTTAGPPESFIALAGRAAAAKDLFLFLCSLGFARQFYK